VGRRREWGVVDVDIDVGIEIDNHVLRATKIRSARYLLDCSIM